MFTKKQGIFAIGDVNTYPRFKDESEQLYKSAMEKYGGTYTNYDAVASLIM